MPIGKTSSTELRQYFAEWLKIAFEAALITRHTREEIVRAMPRHLTNLSRDLNSSGTGILPLGSTTLRIFLREGRNPNRSKFNLFEMQWSRSRQPRKLRCFVGHRFTKSISDSLRLNLRYILEPSNIELLWSGMDMNAVGFFDEIIKLIRHCNFCIFDNRATERKPNVYIEAGIACAFKKPFILANYVGNRIGVPSDLSHILNIPYRDYSDLSRQIYFRLPVFLKHTGLR